MGNLFSLIPVGIDSCGIVSKCRNDQASYTAVNVILVTVSLAGAWQLVSIIWWSLSVILGPSRYADNCLKYDGALGLVFTGIGISFAISTCYPQVITLGGYVCAIGAMLIMYDLVKVYGISNLMSAIPNVIALSLNCTLVWYAASSQERIHPNIDAWGNAGNPKTIIIIISSFLAVSIVVEVLTAIAQFWAQQSCCGNDPSEDMYEAIKLGKPVTNADAVTVTAQIQAAENNPQMLQPAVARYVIIGIINFVMTLTMLVMLAIHTSQVWNYLNTTLNNAPYDCNTFDPNSRYVAHESDYLSAPIVILFVMFLNAVSLVAIAVIRRR